MRRLDACPACDGTSFRVVAEANDDALARYHAFSARKYGGLLDDWLQAVELVVTQCQSCGHHWYRDQPEPSQLDAMYAAGRPLHCGGEPARTPTPGMLKEMCRLRSLAPSGKASLLDFGSGFGRWARAAVQAGFDVCAFEPSQARGGEEDVPFTLVHDRAALQGRTFDVINLEQVLEHVADPQDLLHGIRALCHDTSFVRITVPNLLRCDEGADLWRDWPFDGHRVHVMAPFEHLHGFTPESLRRTVCRAGFEPVAMARLASRYPSAALRSWLGRWLPKLDKTFLIVRPCRG